MSAIHYEMKPGGKKTFLQTMKSVDKICQDKKLQKSLETIEGLKINFSRRVLVQLMRYKLVPVIVLCGYTYEIFSRLRKTY